MFHVGLKLLFYKSSVINYALNKNKICWIGIDINIFNFEWNRKWEYQNITQQCQK